MKPAKIVLDSCKCYENAEQGEGVVAILHRVIRVGLSVEECLRKDVSSDRPVIWADEMATVKVPN